MIRRALSKYAPQCTTAFASRIDRPQRSKDRVHFRRRIQEGPSSIRGNKLHKRSFCNQDTRPSLRSIPPIDSRRPSIFAQRLPSMTLFALRPSPYSARQRVLSPSPESMLRPSTRPVFAARVHVLSTAALACAARTR